MKILKMHRYSNWGKYFTACWWYVSSYSDGRTDKLPLIVIQLVQILNVLHAKATKMLVNDGEMLVIDGEMLIHH